MIIFISTINSGVHMTAEHLRARRDANPFQAFTIHLTMAVRSEYRIATYLSMTLGGEPQSYTTGHDSMSIIDVRLITELRN